MKTLLQAPRRGADKYSLIKPPAPRESSQEDADVASPVKACGGLCCEPPREITASNWQYVGNGQGSFQIKTDYKWVGNGFGQYDQSPQASDSERSSCGSPTCRACAGAVSFFLLAFLLLAATARCWEIRTGSDLIHALPPVSLPLYDKPQKAGDTDCEADYDHWRRSWSAAKQQWCCQHAKRGCPGSPRILTLPEAPLEEVPADGSREASSIKVDASPGVSSLKAGGALSKIKDRESNIQHVSADFLGRKST